MPVSTYKLHRIYNCPVPGSTRPARCSVDAILKFDDPESPHCVYNEYVSLRLAQTCHVPVADGGLILCGDGHAFASLELDSPGFPLPDVVPSLRDEVAERYPNEVAALVAFDVWVGNWDRGEAVKASVGNPHLNLFGAYDHSHALLNIEADPSQSIERLHSADLVVQFHPFYGRVRSDLLEHWLSRICGVSDDTIASVCCFSQPFRGVTLGLQEALGEALCWRKGNIRDIVKNSQKTVRSIPGP